jgi:integrase
MPLTLRAPRPPKSPNYEIRGTYLGVAIERSARTADKKLAIKVKKQIEREIEVGLLTPKSAVTFLEAAVSYMKAGGERSFLGPIIDYNGAYAIRDKAAETIVQEDLNHIADALYPDNTAASRNRAVYTPIIAVLHHAGIERRFKRPKGCEGKRSKSFLEYDQAFALLAEADKIDREFGLLCTTLLYTGRRIGDLLNPNTRLRNLNLLAKEPTLYIGKTKNGDPVTVPLPPIVVEKFKAMPPRSLRKTGMSQADAGVPFLERRPDARLFRFHQGGHLSNLLAQAMTNAGLSFPKRERGFHLFCHTYATWLIRGGMDNYALARTGRWKDPRSVQGYIHNLASHEAKRAAALLPTPSREQAGSEQSKSFIFKEIPKP